MKADLGMLQSSSKALLLRIYSLTGVVGWQAVEMAQETAL